MLAFDRLNEELRRHGVPDNNFMGAKETPLEVLVNTRLSSKPFVAILLEFLPKLKGKEQEMVIRALAEKGNNKASEYLIDIFNIHNGPDDNYLWVVGNALSIIDDPDTYPAIIEICKKRHLGSARQMLLGTLAKINTEEAYEILVDCVKDPTVKGHAIKALGKYGDIRAIDIIEKTEVDNRKSENKAKKTALKHLLRLKEKMETIH